MNILMILTAQDKAVETDEKIGFWREEFSSPYHVFKDAGAKITFTSPRGDQPSPDPKERIHDFLDRIDPVPQG